MRTAARRMVLDGEGSAARAGTDPSACEPGAASCQALQRGQHLVARAGAPPGVVGSDLVSGPGHAGRDRTPRRPKREPRLDQCRGTGRRRRAPCRAGRSACPGRSRRRSRSGHSAAEPPRAAVGRRAARCARDRAGPQADQLDHRSQSVRLGQEGDRPGRVAAHPARPADACQARNGLRRPGKKTDATSPPGSGGHRRGRGRATTGTVRTAPCGPSPARSCRRRAATPRRSPSRNPRRRRACVTRPARS